MNAWSMTRARAEAQHESWALRYRPDPPARGWWDRAACRGLPIELFLDDHPGRYSHVSEPLMALCGGCPVRLQCLRDAACNEAPDPHPVGVRGGLCGTQRQTAREQRRRQTKEAA